jgi:hypothetical protein
LNVSTTTAAPQDIVTATVNNGPGNVGDWVGLYAVGGTNYLAWTYLNNAQTPPAIGLTSATVSFTMPTTPGSYIMRFYAGSMLLATSPTITVAIPPAVTFTISATAAAPLARVTATVANGPGNTGDWIGIYAAGGSAFLDWWYLNGTKVLPTSGLTSASVSVPMPTTPGSYVLKFSTPTRLLATSQTIVVAPTTLTVNVTTTAPQTTVTATIGNGPGFVGDWVGLYAVGSSGLLDWMYLNGTKTLPATGLNNAVVAMTMPATHGSYVLRFSSGQTVVATSPTIAVQ